MPSIAIFSIDRHVLDVSVPPNRFRASAKRKCLARGLPFKWVPCCTLETSPTILCSWRSTCLYTALTPRLVSITHCPSHKRQVNPRCSPPASVGCATFAPPPISSILLEALSFVLVMVLALLTRTSGAPHIWTRARRVIQLNIDCRLHSCDNDRLIGWWPCNRI